MPYLGCGNVPLLPLSAEQEGTLREERDALMRLLETANREVKHLQAAVAKMSHRRCHRCGHVAYYLSGLTLDCRCEQCGSADTRLIRDTAESQPATPDPE